MWYSVWVQRQDGPPEFPFEYKPKGFHFTHSRVLLAQRQFLVLGYASYSHSPGTGSPAQFSTQTEAHLQGLWKLRLPTSTALLGHDLYHLQRHWQLCSAGCQPAAFSTSFATPRLCFGIAHVCNTPLKALLCRSATSTALFGHDLYHLQRHWQLCSAGCQPAGLCFGIAHVCNAPLKALLCRSATSTALLGHDLYHLQRHWQLCSAGCQPAAFCTSFATPLCSATCRALLWHRPCLQRPSKSSTLQVSNLHGFAWA